MMNLVTARRLSASYDAERASWAAVRELCCRTGNNGDPIASERWKLFSRIWIEPYEKIFPDWTYVAENGGSIVGYLTGCPDSRKFYRLRPWRATAPLLIAIASGRYYGTPGAGEVVKQVLGLRKSTEDHFPSALRSEIAHYYPAHLHINIDASHRRKGVGRALIKKYFGDLRRSNVQGVHLYCGADPVNFYKRMGFQELGGTKIQGVSVFALGVRLLL